MSKSTTKRPENPEAGLAEQTRLAMRRQAATVSVVSVLDADGQRHAMTATSITSVSMAPPSLLICVNHWATVYEAMKAGLPFCINILAENQQKVADYCSRGQKSENHFKAGSWKNGYDDLPYLEGAQANVFCYNDESICYATHTVFIGRVQQVYLHGEVAPLMYLNGGYIHL